MSQPVLHDLDCAQCIQFVYLPREGWKEGPPRNGERMRHAGKPPCAECPKGKPETAFQHELTPRNRAAVRLWLRHRAMGFQSLSEFEKTSPRVQRDFEIIDAAFRQHERDNQSAETMMMLQAALSGMLASKGK